MSTAHPPGWHLDPSLPAGTYRFWDGTRWTEQTSRAEESRPAPEFGSQDATATPFTAAPVAVQPSTSRMEGNPASMTAIGFAVAYVVLAVTTGIVLLGIVPAMWTFRAFSRGEKLAPVALLAAGVAIALSIAARSGH
jgi:hypothetical protein